MYVIGLTGGIGTGKSVVAEILREQGAEILNADLVGHEAYLPGTPVYDDIVAEFGRDVVAEDGTIDRKKLGSIVFSSPDKLARLNAITHPRMKEMMREKLVRRRLGRSDERSLGHRCGRRDSGPKGIGTERNSCRAGPGADAKGANGERRAHPAIRCRNRYVRNARGYAAANDRGMDGA